MVKISNKSPEEVDAKLPVMESFHSLQGEGYFSGHSAYFIRLGGCDVGCPWCDVKESWDIENHPQTDIAKLVYEAKSSGSKFAVITGGEPCIHNLIKLTTELRDSAIRTHLETSGSHPLTGKWDWVTFSPKRYKKPLEEYFVIANELKIIIAHKNDLRWAKEFEHKVGTDCLLYIQPEWEGRINIEPHCVEFIKENPHWQLSLQTHKYIGIS